MSFSLNLHANRCSGYGKGCSAATWLASTLKIFHLIANLGLIFFMFFLGLELDLAQIKAT